MNYKTSLYATILLSISYFAISAQELTYSPIEIEITGTFIELNINESINGKIDVKHQLLEPGKKAYSLSGDITLTTINLLQKGIYNISVPKGINVTCKPIEIAGETGWYKEQNNHKISLSNLSGEVIVDADGYDVKLVDITGPTSVVTYGDINAKYNETPTAEIISLDTYQGNITVHVPENTMANIKATAKNGTVMFAESIKYELDENEQTVVTHLSKNASVKLHTEDGDFIKVDTNKDPTHPELRDKLIKLFIRDQGKKGMDSGSRLKLNKLGFEDYINSQPDIRPFTDSTLAEELSVLIDQYGFPSPEMVGDGYAMDGVQMILFNSKPKYMNKYKEDYAKYWPWLQQIYYDRGNGKR